MQDSALMPTPLLLMLWLCDAGTATYSSDLTSPRGVPQREMGRDMSSSSSSIRRLSGRLPTEGERERERDGERGRGKEWGSEREREQGGEWGRGSFSLTIVRMKVCVTEPLSHVAVFMLRR